MFESKVNKGKAWGYAPLDNNRKVPLANLPPIQATIDTGSFVTNNQTGSFATTGSNTFNGPQNINGRLNILSSSIQCGVGQSGDGNSNDVLKLIPDNDLYNNDQLLIVDPTFPNHIHIRAGGTQDNSNATLFLGGENSNVQIGSGENPPVNIVSNNHYWEFGTNGNLTLPNDIYAQESNDLNITVYNPDNEGGVTFSVRNRQVNNGNNKTTQFEVGPRTIVLSTNFTDDKHDWIFDYSGSLIVPGDIIGASNLATTGSNTFIGNQNISGSVNISSSLTVSSTFVNNGNLDALNSDLIIEGGYLILTGSAVPTDLTGSLGDTQGMFVIDNNHIYYNTTNYIPEIIAGVYNTAVQVHNTWTNDMYGADSIFIQDNGSNPTPQVGWIVTNGTISRTIVSSGYGVNHQSSGFGPMWLLQLDSSANFNSDNTVTLLEQSSANANWKTAKLNPSPYKNATIESVNYAPFGSGSWNVNPPTEVTILDIDKSIHLLDITDAAGDSHWFLPDGYDGQVVKLALKGNGAQTPNSVYVWMNNLRTYNGTIQSATAWSPFWDNDGNGYDIPRSLATAVFVDGAWNIDSDWWGM